MANNYGRVGPATALQLLLLWLEGKHTASVTEVEAWEGVVIHALNDVERKASTLWGSRDDETPDWVKDPSDD